MRRLPGVVPEHPRPDAVRLLPRRARGATRRRPPRGRTPGRSRGRWRRIGPGVAVVGRDLGLDRPVVAVDQATRTLAPEAATTGEPSKPSPSMVLVRVVTPACPASQPDVLAVHPVVGRHVDVAGVRVRVGHVDAAAPGGDRRAAGRASGTSNFFAVSQAFDAPWLVFTRTRMWRGSGRIVVVGGVGPRHARDVDEPAGRRDRAGLRVRARRVQPLRRAPRRSRGVAAAVVDAGVVVAVVLELDMEVGLRGRSRWSRGPRPRFQEYCGPAFTRLRSTPTDGERPTGSPAARSAGRLTATGACGGCDRRVTTSIGSSLEVGHPDGTQRATAAATRPPAGPR